MVNAQENARLRFQFLLSLVLASCSGGGQPPVPPPETFEQMLLRTEGVTCAAITQHVGEPVPDCAQVYDAFVRGRNRAAKTHADANFRMDVFAFYRPEVVWSAAGYPIMKELGVRGHFELLGSPRINYSYEQVIEHETVHGMLFLLIGLDVRTPEAVAAEGDQSHFTLLYQIGCHNTTDDRWGDHDVSVSGRSGCILPYTGPVLQN